ncbi:MAG: hypothetical protein ACKPB7_16720, partial [Sphaerospermopsis kisseleviana]
NYRVLARKTLKDFIYRMVGYDPQNLVPSSWQHFHDRMLLNPIPAGYYSVFKEIANIVISAIQEGLVFDSHTIPDISVGLAWSKFWNSNGLEAIYGSRGKYPHEYPSYFPQSLANDSIEAYIYPIKSLGEFRKWFELEYLVKQFPAYIKGKVKKGLMQLLL